MSTVVEKPTRAFASHVPKWQKFQTDIQTSSQQLSMNAVSNNTTQHPYQRQYSHVYAKRLAMLKPRCWESVDDTKISSGTSLTRVQRILDLREDTPSIVVGTIVKEAQEKEEVLTVSNNDNSTFLKTKCHASDVLILEDESGRVTLECGDQVHQYTTGVVVAVQGTVKEGGILHVDRFFAPKPAPLANRESTSTADTSTTPHVLLISGLECGNPNASSLQRDMLLMYILGQLNNTASARKIARIVFLGGNTSNTTTDGIFGIKELDGFLAQLCAAGVPVDIMPGANDPTTANWPQRPLHSSLLKYSVTFRNNDGLICRTPNPYAAGIGGVSVLATDGTNVRDLQSSVLYVKDNDDDDMKDDNEENAKTYTFYSELDALGQTLAWGHVCPTGPDSVPTVPHAEVDPMVITETPQLYAVGNCRQFDTKAANDTRLVCVPKFSETGEVVLVNLESLECEIVKFDED